MKYVKTKNGIYELVKDNVVRGGSKVGFIREGEVKLVKYGYDCDREYGVVDRHNEVIIAQADTIEELVDEFVIVSPLFKKPRLSYYPSLKEVIDEDLCAKDELYGEIWVNGELHKVAKMNEKGELELL